MKIKKKVISSLLSAAMISGLYPSSALAKTGRAPTDKPNVIILLLDDSGYSDIGANGGIYPTPNLDKMASSSLNLSSFYTSSPVSSPSRAGLLTGRLGSRTGMWGEKVPVFFEFDKDGLPKSEITIADMLRDNGYKTMMLGKWHLGIGQDGVEHIPTRHGFQEWYGIPTSNDMFFTDPIFDNKNLLKQLVDGKTEQVKRIAAERDTVIADKNGKGKQEAFSVPVYHSFSYDDGSYKDNILGVMHQAGYTQDITNRAVDYIKSNSEDPFFMFVSYPQTHVPLFTSDAFTGKTKNSYGDVMTEIDYSVGRILDTLSKEGIDENTMIVFTSDNGPWLLYDDRGASGSALPYRSGKNATYEGGVRVPGLIQWKGQINPGKSDAMISLIDLYPTIANLTQSTLPAVELDGYDMTNTFLKGDASPRKNMPYYYMGDLQAFRSGNWKIHFMTSGLFGKQKLNTPELYNLEDDPSESNNLAEKYPDIVKRLVKESSEYHNSLGKWASPLFDLNDGELND